MNQINRATIASITITKNEERNMTACLESLKWVDELIVVDAESTDRTAELARGYTPRVFVRRWPGYGPQKNFAMEQAAADWILIVDADERVSNELRDEILSILRKPPSPLPSPSRGEGMLKESPSPVVPSPLEGEGEGGGKTSAAYRIPRRNFYYGTWIRGAGQYPDPQLRLIRRGRGRYNDLPVHEHLEVEGPVADLQGHLDHQTHPTILSHELKIERYSTLAAEERIRAGRPEAAWYHLLVNPLWTFLKAYLLRGGYRDGMTGFLFSAFSAAHVLLKYAKLWEHAHSARPHGVRF